METLPDIVFRSTLTQAKSSNHAALTCLYYQFQPAILAYVSRCVPIIARDDIVSEVFLTMVKDIRIVRAQDEEAFRNWLYTIAHMMVVRYYQSRDKEQTVTVRMEAVSHGVQSYDDPTQPIEVRETVSAVLKAINALSTEKRHIVLSKVKGIPDAFLSQLLGKTESAIRVMRHRTLQLMNTDLGHIIIVLFTCLAAIGCVFIVVGRAQPGGLLYPVKQSINQFTAPTATPEPTQTPFPIPSFPAFTPTSTPIPTPTQTPTATPVSSPVPPARQATTPASLPVDIPAICVLGVCG